MTIRVADLHVLEHLAYILGALGAQTTGEAKWEIRNLRQRLPDLRPTQHALIDETLAEVDRTEGRHQDHLDWPRIAAITVSRLSDRLWKSMLADLKGIDELTPTR